MRGNKSKTFLILFFSIIFIPFFVFAQTQEPSYEDKESARIHFEAAKKLYKGEKYSEALELFMKAYARYPRPEILYNIGRCYDKLGDYENAIKYYDQYIKLKPDAEDRQEVEELIKNLKEAIRTPEIAQRGIKRPFPYKTTGYILAITGIAITSLGPVFYIKADSIYNDLEKRQYDRKTRMSKIDDIHTYDNLSLGCYITGGILIGGSIYFLYKGYTNKSVAFLPYDGGYILTFSGEF